MRIVPLALEHVAGCVAVAASLPEWFSYPGALEGIEEATSSQRGYVAVEGEVVLGFVATKPAFAESLEITYLAVHAAHRRSGIGRQLVLAAKDLAADLGASEICLLTLGESAKSAAYAETVAFYRSIGFWRTKEIELSSWGGAPALLMSAPLQRLG